MPDEEPTVPKPSTASPSRGPATEPAARPKPRAADLLARLRTRGAPDPGASAPGSGASGSRAPDQEIDLEIDDEDTVGDLKTKVASIIGTDPQNLAVQYLRQGKFPLGDAGPLKGFFIKDGSSVSVVVAPNSTFIKGGKVMKIKVNIFKEDSSAPDSTAKKPEDIPDCLQQVEDLIKSKKKPEDITQCGNHLTMGTQMNILQEQIKSKDDTALCTAIDKENNFICVQYAYAIFTYIKEFVFLIAKVDKTLDKLLQDYKYLREASRKAKATFKPRQSEFFNKFLSETAENIVQMIQFHKAWQARMSDYIEYFAGNYDVKNFKSEYDVWPSDIEKVFKGDIPQVASSTLFARFPPENEVQNDPNQYWQELDKSTKAFVGKVSEAYNQLNADVFVKLATIEANSTYVKAALKALALYKKDSTLSMCDPFEADQRTATLKVDNFQIIISGLVSSSGDTTDLLAPIVDCFANRITSFNTEFSTSQIDIDSIPNSDILIAFKDNKKFLSGLRRRLGI